MLEPKFRNGQVIAINLKKSATIEGRDFFGRKAWLKFEPHNFHGWYKGPVGNIITDWLFNTQITPRRVDSRRRRLCLTDMGGKNWLNCPEHITVLRLLGLDRLVISCGPSNWPPYLLAGELWEKLSPYLEEADYCLEWRPFVESSVRFLNKNIIRKTIINSPGKEGIDISSAICYDKYIKFASNFHYDAEYCWGELIEILNSPTQGWPRALYPISCMANLLRWPHQKRICWAKGEAAPITGEQFNRHRILDILGFLGAISLVGNKLISCRVTSNKGGHLSDVRAFRNLG